MTRLRSLRPWGTGTTDWTLSVEILMETIKVRITEDMEPAERDRLLDAAAAVLRRGGTVAFPTETVYGLGADALDPDAVEGIFRAKGRPQDNPLIIHVSDRNLDEYAEHIPEKARELMDRYWPGPLTVILMKKDIVPEKTSAGLDTIGIRMPDEPLAIEIIRRLGRPVAAPSANISGRPSPTTYERCIEDLDGKVDMIVGGGRSTVGLESTIVDYTVVPPRVLRPGGITLEMLNEVDPSIEYMESFTRAASDEGPKAPGMKYRHYSPKAPILIVKGEKNKVVEKIRMLVQNYMREGKKVGILAPSQRSSDYVFDVGSPVFIGMGSEDKPHESARLLFEVLRSFDDLGCDMILSEAVREEGLGAAVMNRLSKAAGFNIIEV